MERGKKKKKLIWQLKNKLQITINLYSVPSTTNLKVLEYKTNPTMSAAPTMLSNIIWFDQKARMQPQPETSPCAP